MKQASDADSPAGTKYASFTVLYFLPSNSLTGFTVSSPAARRLATISSLIVATSLLFVFSTLSDELIISRRIVQVASVEVSRKANVRGILVGYLYLSTTVGTLRIALRLWHVPAVYLYGKVRRQGRARARTSVKVRLVVI